MKHNLQISALFSLLIFFCTSCKSQNSKSPIDVSKIVIEDKTINNYIPSKIEVTDSVFITSFMYQVNKMQTLNNRANVKVNNGYYEVSIYLKNGKKEEIDIIETVFEGIIINKNMQHYKCNDLYLTVIGKFMEVAKLSKKK